MIQCQIRRCAVRPSRSLYNVHSVEFIFESMYQYPSSLYIYIFKLVGHVINHVRKTAFVSVIKQWQWTLILHENHWKAFLVFFWTKLHAMSLMWMLITIQRRTNCNEFILEHQKSELAKMSHIFGNQVKINYKVVYWQNILMFAPFVWLMYYNLKN